MQNHHFGVFLEFASRFKTFKNGKMANFMTNNCKYSTYFGDIPLLFQLYYFK